MIVADDTFGDEDVIKVCFTAFPSGAWGRKDGEIYHSGKGRHVDVSPYRGTFDQCAALIELSIFDREQVKARSPFRQEDIDKLWKDRFGGLEKPKIKD